MSQTVIVCAYLNQYQQFQKRRFKVCAYAISLLKTCYGYKRYRNVSKKVLTAIILYFFNHVCFITEIEMLTNERLTQNTTDCFEMETANKLMLLLCF